MKEIGFICDIRNSYPPIHHHAVAWVNRIVPMSSWLKEQYNISLLIYSPYHVNLEDGTVKGYYLIKGEFIAQTSHVPTVNGSWFYSVFKRPEGCHSYSTFLKWASERGKLIFPRLDLSILVNDKFASYKYVKKILTNIQPYTEVFSGKAQQLKEMLGQSRDVFLKPRYGGHGDGILVIRQKKSQFTVSFYNSCSKWSTQCTSLYQLTTAIAHMIKDDSYIIQSGISTQLYNNSAIDLRIVTLYTTRTFYTIPRLRVGQTESEVSNIGQGGSLVEPEQVLNDIFQPGDAKELIDNATKLAIQIASELNRDYSDNAFEVAFDFLIDEQKSIYLAEMNLQPDMGFPGHKYISGTTPLNFKNILSLSKDEQAGYEKYTQPYGQHLAEYFYQILQKT